MAVEFSGELASVASAASAFTKNAADFLGVFVPLVSCGIIYLIFFSEAGRKARIQMEQATKFKQSRSAPPTQ